MNVCLGFWICVERGTVFVKSETLPTVGHATPDDIHTRASVVRTSTQTMMLEIRVAYYLYRTGRTTYFLTDSRLFDHNILV
jgi:hypothetical protein